MTTTRRRRPPLSTRNLRPHLIALLSLAYVAAWWSFHQRRGHIRAERVLPVRPPTPVVWYGELPPAERPAVTLPAGWVIAPAADAPPTFADPRPVRAASARTGRIRTRSS